MKQQIHHICTTDNNVTVAKIHAQSEQNKFQPFFNAIHAEKLFLAGGTLYKTPRFTSLTPMTLLPPPLLQISSISHNLKKHKRHKKIKNIRKK